VQHARNGIDFKTFARIDGNGTVDDIRKYRVVHKSPHFGDNYYRLKQVDFDGKYEYHHIIRVQMNSFIPELDFIIYPNPASLSNINLRIRSFDGSAPIQIRVIDLLGKVYFKDVIDGSGLTELAIPNDLSMSVGIYIIEMGQGEVIIQRKLIIE